MKKILIQLFSLLITFQISCNKDKPALVQDVPTEINGMTLVWNDEFNSGGLPASNKWSYDVGGHGWGNQELQYYTEKRLENARQENGVLVIEARKEYFEGMKYTSARLVSKHKGDWLYGRFEIRAKLPAGRGTWPAIWMLPSSNNYGNMSWPDNGEIDIMEHVGYDPGAIHSTVHTKDYNHTLGTQRGGTIKVADAMTAFHTYVVEWSADSVVAFMDDTKYFAFKNEQKGWSAWPFDKPFHLILNIAIGGSWGGVQGVDDSIFPTKMEIDYVRVYQKK